MSISMEISASLYDHDIARALQRDMEFLAGVLERLTDMSDHDITELSDHLSACAIDAIRQLQKAADLSEGEAS